MYTVRPQVALHNFADWTDGEFTPGERRAAELKRVLDQVVAHHRGGPPAARLRRRTTGRRCNLRKWNMF